MKPQVTVVSTWNGKDVKVSGKSTIGKTIYELGLIVEGQGKMLSPVKTGRLAGSITTQASDNGTSPQSPATAADRISPPTSEHEVFVGTAVDYGPYVEFGTVHSSAQPYLRPALDLARGQTLTVGTANGRREFGGYLQ